MPNINDLYIDNVEWTESDMFVYVDTRETFTPEELANEYEVTEEFLRDYLTPGWEKHPIYLHSRKRRQDQAIASCEKLQELKQSQRRIKNTLIAQAKKRATTREKLQTQSLNYVRYSEDMMTKEAIQQKINRLQKELNRLIKAEPLINLALDGGIKLVDDKIDYYLEYYKNDIAKLRNLRVTYDNVAAYYGVEINRLKTFCKKHDMTKKHETKK